MSPTYQIHHNFYENWLCYIIIAITHRKKGWLSLILSWPRHGISMTHKQMCHRSNRKNNQTYHARTTNLWRYTDCVFGSIYSAQEEVNCRERLRCLTQTVCRDTAPFLPGRIFDWFGNSSQSYQMIVAECCCCVPEFVSLRALDWKEPSKTSSKSGEHAGNEKPRTFMSCVWYVGSRPMQLGVAFWANIGLLLLTSVFSCFLTVVLLACPIDNFSILV